ncbi:hypothetical protein ACKVMT_10145 [Halobacteriales archaeon Cl-PHB]
MEAPHQLRTAAADHDDVTIARRQYEDGEEVVIDFGPAVDAEVDVVGGTAIVVAGDDQYEFDVPEEATEITTNDGMLTIRS